MYTHTSRVLVSQQRHRLCSRTTHSAQSRTMVLQSLALDGECTTWRIRINLRRDTSTMVKTGVGVTLVSGLAEALRISLHSSTLATADGQTTMLHTVKLLSLSQMSQHWSLQKADISSLTTLSTGRAAHWSTISRLSTRRQKKLSRKSSLL